MNTLLQDADSAPGFRESNRLVFISFGSRELANRNPAFGCLHRT